MCVVVHNLRSVPAGSVCGVARAGQAVRAARASVFGRARRGFVLSAWFRVLAVLLFVACGGRAWAARDLRVLDRPAGTVYDVNLGLVPSSRGEDGSKVALLEVGMEWAAAYWYAPAGDVDVTLELEGIWFPTSTIDVLPGQVGRVVVDAGWTARLGSDFAFQARVAPGYYCDLSDWGGDSFFVPVSLSFIEVFGRDFLASAGVTVRPGFRDSFMPRVGLAWQITNRLRWDGILPESRLICAVTDSWSVYAAFAWRNEDFNLAEPADQMTLEDFRGGLGLIGTVLDQFRISLELGTVFGRTLALKGASDVDVEDAFYAGLTVGVY